MTIKSYINHNKLLLPAISIIIGIWAVPFIYQIIISFVDYRISSPDTKFDFVGIDNYKKALIEDSFYHQSLTKTIIFTFFTLVLETLLGLFFAILLVSLPTRIKKILTIVLIVPIVLAPFVVGLMWNFQFNPSFGPISYFTKEIGLLGEGSSILNSANAFKAICLVDVWQNTPFMTLIFASAISGIPKHINESLKIHQVTTWEKIRKVYLKYILPIGIIAVFLRFIGLIKSFDTIHILTQGGPSNITETYSLYAYRLSFKELNFGLGSAEALIVNYGIIFLVLIILKRINFYKL